jgi:tetratricopeptide (TPR) repeat protein
MPDELPQPSSSDQHNNLPQVNTSVGGGVNLDAERDVNIGGDIIGRDKIITAGDDIVMGDQIEAETYIEHATIIHDRTNRIWLAALAGIVGVIAIVLGIVATRPATAPAPVLTVIIPANEPTATPPPNTPTPTATPIFAENVPYRVAIAKFNQLSDRKLAIEQRLEDDLDQQLQAAGLSDEVEVKVVSQPVIESAEDAERLAESTQSSVVIWGLYDDVGIRLRVSLGSRASLSQTVPGTARFGELPLTSAGSETGTLSFYITSTLPANTSFMSFYVIGHLYYLSNQYAKGYAAFDTAMQQLPQTVAVENEALLHFFNARVMDTTTVTGTVNAICEYANAIEADQQMFEAYNNLGVLAARDEVALYSYLWPEDQRAQQRVCTDQINIGFDARELFSKTLRIRPDWAVAQYNLGALDWNIKDCRSRGYCEGNPDQELLQSHERAEARFFSALKLDPSLPGAHLSVGAMAMWRGDFVAASQHFSTALSLMPQSPEVAINLGHALALTGREPEAEAAFRTAIRNAPKDSAQSTEAHLALGILYHRQGDLTRARVEYGQADERLQKDRTQDSYWAAGNALITSIDASNLALTMYDIDVGEWMSATQRVEGETNSLYTYLLWLVSSTHGFTVSFHSEDFYLVTDEHLVPPFAAWSSGNVSQVAWYDLVKQCKTSAEDDFRTWGSSANPCLPTDPQKRINAVLEIIQQRLQQRLYYAQATIMQRGACPYIFTYNDQSRQWAIDTTILYKLVRPQAETTQARPLSRFDGQLLLREVEPETSYVDMIAVRLITADGREITLKLNDPLLGAADRHYLVLHQGDQRLLTFDVPEGALPAREAWVVAAGYYIPLPFD